MAITFQRASSEQHIQDIAALAQVIWEEHFTPIIGRDQVAYMLNKFQSAPPIREQIQSGTAYYIVQHNHTAVGYTALIDNTPKTMISKLYILASARRTGAGKATLDFIEARSRSQQHQIVWLTVNKDNAQPIAWYKRQGFRIIDSVKKPIGDGFFMDDYIMEKAL